MNLSFDVAYISFSPVQDEAVEDVDVQYDDGVESSSLPSHVCFDYGTRYHPLSSATMGILYAHVVNHEFLTAQLVAEGSVGNLIFILYLFIWHLARLMEKSIVKDYLYPTLLHSDYSHLFQDQFTVWPTGSTTAAVIYLLHTLTELL